MPRPLMWLARVVTTLVVLCLALAGAGVLAVRASFPQVSGDLKVKGLTGKVTVYRDKTGVPHIYADSSEDLFLAQGYVHAQDRFFEMDFRRHVTAGRLSEMFGPSTLPEDKAIRTMGWRRIAERELPMLSEQTRRYLDAYARGVNSWMEQHEGALGKSLEYGLLRLTNSGYQPEPWTPVDSVAWLKAMAWDLRSNLSDEIGRAVAASKLPRERVEQLWPGYPFGTHRPIVTKGSVTDHGFDQAQEPRGASPGPEESADPTALTGAAATVAAVPSLMGDPKGGNGIGSNSWVVGGAHTASGKPLLANDPHLAPGMPSIWYQAGLHCRTKSERCSFDVTGFTFSGLPGVIIGHNDRVAWGFTNLGPDVADLYLERVKDDSYLFMGEWRPLTTRAEKIEVAGGDPVTLTVRETLHGPIISDVMGDAKDALPGAATVFREPADAVALKWTALEPGRTADAIFDLNTARDWPSFRAAASKFEVPSQNMVYADVDGNIGYQAPGRIPVRTRGDGTWPVPGWTGEYSWQSTIPFQDLPSAYNPPEGYVVTANNAVVDPGRYPHMLTKDWAYGYRSQRILDRLGAEIAKGKVDVETMGAVQQDTGNGLAPFLVPRLTALKVAGDPARALDLLRSWDGSQGVDSAPAAYFNAVWRHLLIETFNDDLPEVAWPTGGDRWFEVVRVMLDRPQDPFWDDTRTPQRETRDDMLRRAMALGYDELRRLLGEDVKAWRWGEAHTLTLTSQTFGSSGISLVERLFNRGPFPVPGNDDAVDAAGWDVQEGYEVSWLPSMRMVVDLADLDRSRWINLTGASGHAFHANYWDQAPLWADGGTTPMLSREESVRKAAVDTLTLTP
ncbi:penicillin acylase family protein [Streptosporangium sp. NPDC020145]|uniref:penicillin acylase family protein n=1 Tax=Streptosporangium sp. NPDC020145 TaxID=3154694 RepID=UPI003437D2CA